MRGEKTLDLPPLNLECRHNVVNNYRRITILPIMGKIFEWLYIKY